MSLYYLTPHIRNKLGSAYISSFCKGKWKVPHLNGWLELNPKNTRIRDKNNESWIETCDGHLVEDTNITTPNNKPNPQSNCGCYSKNFNPELNRNLNTHILNKAVAKFSEPLMLQGTLLSIFDSVQHVYFLAYVKNGDRFTLNLTSFDKSNTAYDSIVLDSVSVEPIRMSMYEDVEALVIRGNTITYRILGGQYISAQYLPYEVPEYETMLHGDHYTIIGNTLYKNDITLLVLPIIGEAYSMLILSGDIAVCVLKNNTASFYNVEGKDLGSSVVDCEAAFFFGDPLVSVKKYNHYYTITEVTHAY